MKAKENSNEEATVSIPILLPHHVLRYLFVERGICIPQSSVDKYWNHVHRFCPWAKDLPGGHMPLTLYGDTARYGQGSGFFLSLTLWRPRSTRMCQWLLFSVNADLSLGPRTLNPLLRVIVESLNAAFDGRSPEGHTLPHRYCVCELKGDWEYHWQTMRLERYWRTRFLCWRCHAENHTAAVHSFLDFRDRPTWQQAQISHNEFVVNIVKPDHV